MSSNGSPLGLAAIDSQSFMKPAPSRFRFFLILAVTTSAVWAFNAAADEKPDNGVPTDTKSNKAGPALKDVFRDDFLIGVALNLWHFSEGKNPFGGGTDETAIVEKHFNAITPENAMKWMAVHPEPGRYDFDEADRFVAFGQQRGMFTIGHTLVWHSQAPRWVFEDPGGKALTKAALLERMRDHIHTVVGRYKGRIRGWDVVNEAVDDDGTLRQSPWLKIIGEDYLVKAFQFAHEADPEAELYYNDFGLEWERKRAGAVELIKKLQAAGVRVTGVGLQGHYNLEHPTALQIGATIETFARLGLKVMITELDVNVLPTPGDGGADIAKSFTADPKWNPYADRLPAEMEQQLAQRYAELFTVFLEHRPTLSRVTFWGVSDRSSWLNHFPIPGRTNYPLLFDRRGQPKPAFQTVVDVALKRPQKR